MEITSFGNGWIYGPFMVYLAELHKGQDLSCWIKKNMPLPCGKGITIYFYFP
jgi:hypothetical protein